MKAIQPEMFSETEIIYNKDELTITVRDENCSTDIKCTEDNFDECARMLTVFVSPESAISADAGDICVLNSEENTVFMLKGDFTGEDCVTEAIKKAFEGQEKVKNVGILFEVFTERKNIVEGGELLINVFLGSLEGEHGTVGDDEFFYIFKLLLVIFENLRELV